MIYLDNAATTKMKSEVLEAMMPYMTDFYGNPSSVYQLGAKSRNAITIAREEAASVIGAKENEVFFTSGGTESDNWAIKGALAMKKDQGCHVITSAVEHHGILHTLERLEEDGLAEVTVLGVDQEGMVDLKALEEAIRPDTVLITIMTANNEIGTIQPVAEIGRIAKEHNILFHTDAVQAFGQIPMDVHELGVDLLSASAHKIYGPKGVGLLYVNEKLPMRSYIQGGPQEKNRRAGTENVPGIVGFGKACQLAKATLDERMTGEAHLRDHMIGRLLAEIPGCVLNGPVDHRLPGNVNIFIPGATGELMLIMLDRKEICASAGSACTSGSLDPSHVLQAIGRDGKQANGAIRFTLSDETTLEEVDQACDVLVAAAKFF